MTIDPAIIARFFWCDQSRHENDRHGVQRPIRFELRRHFEAVGMRHDQIKKNEIGVEAPCRFQGSVRIVFRAHDVIVRVFKEKTRAARELRVVIYD